MDRTTSSSANLTDEKQETCQRSNAEDTVRQYHSTKTVVTKVYNDMLMAADGDEVSALIYQQLLTRSTKTC